MMFQEFPLFFPFNQPISMLHFLSPPLLFSLFHFCPTVPQFLCQVVIFYNRNKHYWNVLPVAVSSVYLYGFLWIYTLRKWKHRGWLWHAEWSWRTCYAYLKCDYSDHATYCDCLCSFKTADFHFGRNVFALIMCHHKFCRNLHFQMRIFFIKTDMNHCWQRPNNCS